MRYTVVRRTLRVISGNYFQKEETLAIGVSQAEADTFIRRNSYTCGQETRDTDKIGPRYYRNGVPVTYDVWNAGI